MSDLPYRSLPSVDRLLREAPIRELLERYQREAVVELTRRVIADARRALAGGEPPLDPHEAALRVARYVDDIWENNPRGVINATGVILHTNAGRAPLSAAAVQAMIDVASYSNLEIDLARGERDSRQERLRHQLTALTGAESATVTVNAASAILLALASSAAGREVLISRGQSVEIGGGFRVPVILRQSGARLVEVGTTNRTRVDDYEEAITERTAAILHVHASNFRISGFTESVPLSGLATLARTRGLLLIADNGSGALLPTERFNLAHEPTVQEAVAAGCDLVAFSGDKLLGGPQAGILVGSRKSIAAASRHPLARVVRPDKITIAALSSTLLSYLRDDAVETLPIWQMIAQSAEAVRSRAERWARAAADNGVQVDVVDGESTVGGGSLPGEVLPTSLLVLPRDITASRLRRTAVPILARTGRGRTLLDLRTVPPSSETTLLDAVIGARRDDGTGGTVREETSSRQSRSAL